MTHIETIGTLARNREEAIANATEEADGAGYKIVEITDISAPDSTCVVFTDGSAEWLVRAKIAAVRPEAAERDHEAGRHDFSESTYAGLCETCAYATGAKS